jgi:hypothetical protein
MTKANTETFQIIYFSGLMVRSERYLMNDCVVDWIDRHTGEKLFLLSPETHHQYLKFVESIKKNKPLLAELR